MLDAAGCQDSESTPGGMLQSKRGVGNEVMSCETLLAFRRCRAFKKLIGGLQ